MGFLRWNNTGIVRKTLLSAMAAILCGGFLVSNVFGSAAYADIPRISNQQARDIAVEHLGHGTAVDTMLFFYNDVLTFEVDVRHQNVRYTVYVNAINGRVARMSRHEEGFQGITTLPEVIPPQGITSWDHVVPRSPARRGGPSNPPVSAQRAVELAYNHLLSIGITDARFDYVYMDRERGQWVWSVEFDRRGRDLEFYVNVDTGAFLKAPEADGISGASPQRGRRRR